MNDSAVMQDGVICRSCGYDLTQQPLDGACTECGVPVHDSIRLRPFAQAGGDYLNRFANGLLMWILSLFPIVLSGLFELLGVQLFNIGFELIALALAVTGGWLLTMPDPDFDPPPGPDWRSHTRTCVIVNGLLELLMIVLYVLPAYLFIRGVGVSLSYAASIVTTVVGLYYLEQLTRRFADPLPAQELSAQANRLIRLTIGAAIAAGVFLLPLQLVPVLPAIPGFALSVGLLLVLPFAIWVVVKWWNFILRYRALLLAEADALPPTAPPIK